jgi:hypothetical protein
MHRGAIAQPIPIGQPLPLVAADLERLKSPRYIASTPQRLRDSHHMIARLAATGLREFKIAEATGYSRVRVQQLLDSPAMQELVSKYRAKVDDTFVEHVDSYFELATSNMVAAERHIADAIAEADEAGELIPIRTALAISRDAADRFGYGKKTQNLNINVDFAAQLERAIARSGKTIDSVPEPVTTDRLPAATSHSNPTQQSAAQAHLLRQTQSPTQDRPRILRRA